MEIGEERLYGVEDPEAPIDEIVESYAAKLGEVCGGDSPAPDMVSECKREVEGGGKKGSVRERGGGGRL